MRSMLRLAARPPHARTGVRSVRAAIGLVVACTLLAPLWAAAAAPPDLAAVERLELGSPAAATARFGAGVALLTDDGRLLHVHPPSLDALELRRGLYGETLVACNGRLLAVDGAGRLASVPPAAGPAPSVALHATPLCLPDGGVLVVSANANAVVRLDAELRPVARAELPVLPDAEPVLLPDGTVAILVEPTSRYRHGVLGDEIEAAGLVRLEAEDLSLRSWFRPPGGRVIEDRRVVAAAPGGPAALAVVVSGPRGGGGVRFLGPDGVTVVASVAHLVGPDRWRHLLHVGRDAAYAVAEPHGAGRLERFDLVRIAPRSSGGGPIRLAPHDTGVRGASHRLGRRALDLAQALPAAPHDPPGMVRLLLPAPDGAALDALACDADGCTVAARLVLPAPAAAPPVAQLAEDGGFVVWASDVAGGLHRFELPAAGDERFM